MKTTDIFKKGEQYTSAELLNKSKGIAIMVQCSLHGSYLKIDKKDFKSAESINGDETLYKIDLINYVTPRTIHVSRIK